MERYETFGAPRIAPPGIPGEYGIWIDGPGTLDDIVLKAPGNELIWRSAVLNTLFECTEGVEVRQSRPTTSVMNSGDEEEPKEILGLFSASHESTHALVVSDR